MQFKNLLSPILCMLSFAALSQDLTHRSLSISEPAPALSVEHWIKGDSIKRFEKGHVYVLEFWATWCAPCIAAMPHMSKLASEYKGKVTFIGVNVYEGTGTTLTDIKQFVDEMGGKMNFNVAIDEDKKMVENWIEGTKEADSGIPRTFVVDGEGRLAWIGHPSKLDAVLGDIVEGSWDLEGFSVQRKEMIRLDSLTSNAYREIRNSKYDSHKQKHIPIYGTPELRLQCIDRLVAGEPMLENSSTIVRYKLETLLDINQTQALVYGTQMLDRANDYLSYKAILLAVSVISEKSRLQPEIYILGAKAYEGMIAQIAYPELVELPDMYNEMAYWYWLGADHTKAVISQEKVIDLLKSGQYPSELDPELMKDELTKFQN
ncbi:TlpA disulfide reductase family protein [Sphingobacterium corticis]|uniref:TlpA disulfide reductase family protein n=1 Tax=Sphingobacterium corticis TaxID=1812823 RepID=A0ABW5NGJ6_9SPHI